MDINTRKRLAENTAFWVFRILSLGVIGILFSILGFIISKGIGVVNWDFITKMPAEYLTAFYNEESKNSKKNTNHQQA